MQRLIRAIESQLLSRKWQQCVFNYLAGNVNIEQNSPDKIVGLNN